MSNTKTQFHDDVKRLLAMFPGLAAYAEEVGKVGSLEDAAKAAEQRIETAKKEQQQILAGHETERSAVQSEIDKAKAKAKEADDKAAKIVAAAHDEAKKIAAKAKADADRTVVTSQQAVDAHNATVEGLRAEIAKQKTMLEEARAEADTANSQLGQLAAKKRDFEHNLAALKARI